MTETKVGELVVALSGYGSKLIAGAQMDATGEACARDEAVRNMLQRCGELALGAASLGRDHNSVALGVVARAIIESLIVLLWVQISEDNALHQREAGLSQFKRIARLNMQSGILKVRDHEGNDVTAEFLASDRFDGASKPKNIEQLAKDAGVSHLYDIFYRYQSLETHGHSMGDDDNDVDTKLAIDLEAVCALSMAIGHVGVNWLVHRKRTDNEKLRELFGFNVK